MDNKDKILMCGNEAIGEGAVQAGCQFYAGYPITPQNELTAYMAKRMYEEKRIFIQSESELSAINMVFGASLVGARAMTTSSSPGISLKQEGISYLVGCELPAVIVNIMRGGPGLGNIAPSQADYFQATRGGGHGDYKTIVLAPSSVQEAFDLTMLAFDLADSYRNPVIVLGDGFLGQMMEPITKVQSVKCKVRNYSKDWILTGCKGRKPRMIRSLFLGEGELEEHNLKLQEKFNRIKNREGRFETFYLEDAEFILVAFGTVSRICKAAVSKLRDSGKKVGLIRPITLWPFPEEIIKETAKRLKGILVVEMNAGQMFEDVRLVVEGNCPVFFYGRMGGGVPTEEEIEHKLISLAV
ncbi:MAG: 3-methyl-2-oxobutanoate dehydrogenase subunit VorB [Candidatus Omnitrophica bacterium]|nr:3-methyl-2-oxobutanoate dehydrogenase subunit VorB [Candidatus Omnitrophota bacterium]